jgi:DNA (cytosine-5)-methyltransferase 1
VTAASINGRPVSDTRGKQPNGFAGAHGARIHFPPRSPKTSIDVELFAGAGGLTLGLAAAGLAPDHLFEQNKHCCNTLRLNSSGPTPHITGQIHEDDIADADWSKLHKVVRVLSAGPPCQPFSLAGKHLADRDGRNHFPTTLRAVRELRPAVVLLENVPGLTRDSFRPYFDYVLRQLECPSVGPRRGELWDEHDHRLQRHQRSARYQPEYSVRWWVVSAADFGVAQSRVRVVLTASRTGLSAIEPLAPTHSREALVRSQAERGYWDSRGLRRKRREEWPRRVRGESSSLGPGPQAWRTVRDALSGLPAPSRSVEEGDDHWIIPGARLYQRHSGSELDWPAKTIKAGVHGVAGGENVLLLDNGRYRYFTLREMARLQCFPDDYRFSGPRSRIIGQIGNAVPVELGRLLGEQVKSVLALLESPRSDRASRPSTHASSQA